MENYKVIGRVGEGAHGYVMKATHLATGQEVALKRLVVKSLENGIPNNVLREIKTLQNSDSGDIVTLVDLLPHGMGFLLVMEYLPAGLWDILRDPYYPITQAQIKSYMKMLLSGIAYLHSSNIIHRDLKPSNLLLTWDGRLKIADMGLARLATSNGRPMSHQVATRWYRAPELLYGSTDYGFAVDMWAAGCIFGELINRTPIFRGESDIEQLAVVLRILGTPSPENWPELNALPDYNKISFPHYAATPWSHILPEADKSQLEFAKCFLKYNDEKRIQAKDVNLLFATCCRSYDHAEAETAQGNGTYNI